MTAQMKTPAPRQGQAPKGNAGTNYVSTGPADPHVLLSRLDKVKQTRTDAWQACCPAHDDRSPSLSIRLAEDGKLLLKCWSGCGAADIVAAIGLELTDLFPRRERDTWSKPVAPSQRWIPRDVLSSIAHEALIAALGAGEAAKGGSLSDADRKRLMVAAGRLRAAAEEVGYDFYRDRFR